MNYFTMLRTLPHNIHTAYISHWQQGFQPARVQHDPILKAYFYRLCAENDQRILVFENSIGRPTREQVLSTMKQVVEAFFGDTRHRGYGGCFVATPGDPVRISPCL